MLFAKALLIAGLSVTALAHFEEAFDKRSPSDPRRCGTPQHPEICDPPTNPNKRSPGNPRHCGTKEHPVLCDPPSGEHRKRSPSDPRRCGTPQHPEICDPPTNPNKRSPGDPRPPCKPGDPNDPCSPNSKRSPADPLCGYGPYPPCPKGPFRAVRKRSPPEPTKRSPSDPRRCRPGECPPGEGPGPFRAVRKRSPIDPKLCGYGPFPPCSRGPPSKRSPVDPDIAEPAVPDLLPEKLVKRSPVYVDPCRDSTEKEGCYIAHGKHPPKPYKRSPGDLDPLPEKLVKRSPDDPCRSPAECWKRSTSDGSVEASELDPTLEPSKRSAQLSGPDPCGINVHDPRCIASLEPSKRSAEPAYVPTNPNCERFPNIPECRIHYPENRST